MSLMRHDEVPFEVSDIRCLQLVASCILGHMIIICTQTKNGYIDNVRDWLDFSSVVPSLTASSVLTTLGVKSKPFG